MQVPFTSQPEKSSEFLTKDVFVFAKQLGETPLQALRRFKTLNQSYYNTSLTYAGRLDPMATGLLLFLKGDAIKEKNSFLHLPKKYTALFLIGLSTDTFDILGKVNGVYAPLKIFTDSEIQNALHSFQGAHEYRLPAFSSQPIQGKPLLWWARHNRLSEIELPKRIMEVYEISEITIMQVEWNKIYNRITAAVGLVEGDFRQDEILAMWKNLNHTLLKQDPVFQLVRCEIFCSSGTYIRTLANELGKQLNTGGMLLNLKRTQIGPYHLPN